MTLTQSSSDANNGSRQRFELELLLQRAVPNPHQLNRSKDLLKDAVDGISPDGWKNLQSVPINSDSDHLDIAILVFLGITIFLIPTFAGIFEDLGAELPAFTQLLVNFSELLRSTASLYAAGAIVIAIWLFTRFYNTHNGRRSID